MDPLSPLRRVARERRTLGLAVVVASLAIAGALLLLLRSRDATPPRALAPADPSAARALAREAERALREGPQGAPVPLSAEGLRELAERWRAPDPPAAATRHRPRAIELRPSQRPERPPLPGVGAERAVVARDRAPTSTR